MTEPARQVIRIRSRARLSESQRQAWESQARWTGYLGGWGSGKTWLGGRAFLRNVLANPPGVDSLIAAPFWSTVWRTTLREFLSVVPAGMVTGQSKRDRYIEVLGRRVYYGSADDPATLDGPTVGAVWIDEGRYVSRDGWRVVFTRLRSKQAKQVRGIITSTPGGPWLEAEFGEGADPKRRLAVHGSTRENASNLAPGTVEDMEATLSERAAKVYIDGQFGLLEGTVYAFEKGRHLIPWKHDPKLPVWVAWDFGWQRPAVLFLQPIPAGTVLPPAKGSTRPRAVLPGSWVVLDELVPDDISTEALAAQVKAKGYRIAGIYCDPAGDGTQTATGISDVIVLKAAGLPQPKWVTAPRLRHIPFGIRVVEGLLGNVRGETRLFVAQHLDRSQAKRGVVKDFLGYCYDEAKDGRPIVDKPKKDGLHDHTMDAIRYFAINEAVRVGQFQHEIRIG